MTAAEEMLSGNPPDTELFFEAARAVSEEMINRSGIRSSTEYKKPAVEGLVFKALHEMFMTNR
jgi:CO/xanthine dehydrogenase FAD-binding subunit